MLQTMNNCLFLPLLLVFLITGASASEETRTLDAVLSDMGYFDIKLVGCTMVYSREVEPTDENNEYFLYTDFFNLNSFSRFDESRVERLVLRGREIYELRFPLDDWYADAYRNVQNFAITVNRRLSGQVWPFEHPYYQVEAVPWLEREIQHSGLLDLGLNGRIDYSKFGQSTVFYPGLYFNFDNSDLLKEFKQETSEYAQINGCDIN